MVTASVSPAKCVKKKNECKTATFVHHYVEKGSGLKLELVITEMVVCRSSSLSSLIISNKAAIIYSVHVHNYKHL